jgi:anaerobic magnesium-protoporphyrin IX monomethyl ester cyclase
VKGKIIMTGKDDRFKVLLIHPLVGVEETYGKFKRLGALQPPLGMCYVAAVLEREGYPVEILDANFHGLAPEVIAEKVERFAPQLVGLYATTMGFYAAQDIAERIKERNGGIPIVIGGPHLFGMAAETMELECFDYGVVGEGEYTALELVRTLESGGDFRRIGGLLFKENGVTVQNPPRTPISNPDELPFPARHLLPPLREYHLKAMTTKKSPATHIFTSRGCPYRCVFCSPVFGRRVRFHSPEYVVAEIEHLAKDYGIREVAINDDTFNVRRERVQRICELLIDKDLGVSWSANVRVNLIDKELLQVMKDAGCWLIQPGVESGNQQVLDFIKKGIKLEQARDTCKWASEVGLQVKPSFILGHPTETKETIEDTIRFAQSLGTHFPAFSLMTPFPGTELWDIAGDYGTFDKNDLRKLKPATNVSFVPDGLTADFLQRKQKEAYRRLYLDPRMIWRHLVSIRGWEDIKKMAWAGLALLAGE